MERLHANRQPMDNGAVVAVVIKDADFAIWREKNKRIRRMGYA
jgi:hypothetical protein